MQKLLEAVLVPFVGFVLSIYFRRIEVAGAENVPEGVPVIYTPNHMNSLVDGLLARTKLPGDPRPLASATLWGVTALRPLLAAVGAIPVYRKQDSQDPAYREQNQDMFAACYDALASNARIVLFPEGESHALPGLQQLKTGVARIALGAEQRHGPLGVRIVPVGLNFDARQKFRSRVLISIGKPIDPLEGVEGELEGELEKGIDGVDPEAKETVDQLMAVIDEGIRSVTLNYPSWEQARLINRAATLYVSSRKIDPEQENLADEFSVHKRLADAYLQNKEQYPLRIDRIVDSVNSYERLLRVLSVQHEHVIQQHPKLLQAIFSIRKLSLFLIRLPLSVLGVLLNALPFFLTRLVSALKVREDRKSTAKLFAGVLLYPLCWSLQASLLGGDLLSPLAWWLLAPLSGVSALLFRERHAQLLEELRTYLKLNTHSEMKQELDQRLAVVCMEVDELLGR